MQHQGKKVRHQAWARRSQALRGCLLCLVVVTSGFAAEQPSPVDIPIDPVRKTRVQKVVKDFRGTVPDVMNRHKVAGMSIALVDRDNILWAEGFGYTAAKGRRPVTPDTPFFLGGISKLIASTAVMLAVQDGLVELDRPVGAYLPDFTVNSRYEKNPESLITLRRLLNQTAGLPAEAPLGNYFEPLTQVSFEEHTRSMYGNWLVYPVGRAFQYSNASLDLAAYILQVTAQQPYEQYVKQRLFAPLGMNETTADRARIMANNDRALGQMMGIARMPSTLPSLGAASVYSTARDLARFVQFHLNEGKAGGQQLLSPALIHTLETPVGIVEPGRVYHGAGVFIDKRPPDRVDGLRWADGWGFGFSGLISWLPEYGIGVVILSNRLPNPGVQQLSSSLMERLIAAKAVVHTGPAPAPDTNGCLGTWWGWSEHKPTPFRTEWRKYCGLYRLRFTAYELEWWARLAVFIKGRDEYTPQLTVHEKDGFLCVTESRFFDLIGLGRHKEEQLQEISPGLFSAASGIVLELSGDVPRWRNYRLDKR